jgi:hypothetical protein
MVSQCSHVTLNRRNHNFRTCPANQAVVDACLATYHNPSDMDIPCVKRFFLYNLECDLRCQV